MGFRTDVQGLRGVAVFCVVLFHTGYLPSGFIGVDMFFVISGFVVTRGLARALAPGGEATADVILGFYKKRVARLLPAFALVAGPVALAALVLGPMSALFVSLKTVIAGLLLMSNGFLYRDSDYFSVGSEGNPFLHLWSLSVEEQFYLVFPFVLATAGLWRPSVSLRIKGLWVMALLSVVSLWTDLGFTFGFGGLEGLLSTPKAFAFYSPVTRAWEFGAGALVALAEHGSPARLPSGLAAAGAGLLISALAFIGVSTPFPGWAAVLPVAGTACLIAAGTPGAVPRTSGLLNARPLVWLGNISYPWYLWHWPVIVFARAWQPFSPWAPVAAGALSVIPAWLSHRVVEERLRIRSTDSPRLQAIKFRYSAAMGLAAFLMATSALLWLGTSSHPAVARQERHADVNGGCDLMDSANRVPGGRCSWGARGKSSDLRIVLIGDSNAGQFSEAVIAGGRELGLPVTIRTASGCPLATGVASPTGPTPHWTRCLAASRGTLEYLSREPPALVVIGVQFGPFRSSGEGHEYSESEIENARVGFRNFLKEADALGHRLLLLAEIPKFRRWPVGLCPAWKIWAEGDAACSYSFPLDEIRPGLAENRRYIETLTTDLPNLRVADFSDFLCPHGQCSSHSNGKLVYRDPTHLSIQGAQWVSPVFLDSLRDALR